jgi:hypothetical protein
LPGKRLQPNLPGGAADHGKRLPKVSLSMTCWVGQRNKHLPLTLFGCEDVILHNRDATSKAMLITQSFKYQRRRVSLLLGDQFVCLKDLMNNPRKTIQLWAADRFVASITPFSGMLTCPARQWAGSKTSASSQPYYG